jgi:hypothetical protein
MPAGEGQCRPARCCQPDTVERLYEHSWMLIMVTGRVTPWGCLPMAQRLVRPMWPL